MPRGCSARLTAMRCNAGVDMSNTERWREGRRYSKQCTARPDRCAGCVVICWGCRLWTQMDASMHCMRKCSSRQRPGCGIRLQLRVDMSMTAGARHTEMPLSAGKSGIAFLCSASPSAAAATSMLIDSITDVLTVPQRAPLLATLRRRSLRHTTSLRSPLSTAHVTASLHSHHHDRGTAAEAGAEEARTAAAAVSASPPVCTGLFAGISAAGSRPRPSVVRVRAAAAATAHSPQRGRRLRASLRTAGTSSSTAPT